MMIMRGVGMNQLIPFFQKDMETQSILKGIEVGMKEQLVSGLQGSAKQLFIAALQQELQRPILVLTHNMFSAQKIAEDLKECLDEAQVLLYPANELTTAELMAVNPEVQSQRMLAMSALAEGFRGIVVSPYAGIRRMVPPKKVMKDARLKIETGQTIALDFVIQKLRDLGYERVDRVEGKGQISVRGGILDVYPLVDEDAFRIEFFDDIVDSIRVFDVSDQRSKHNVKEATITPCKEIIADGKRFRNAAQHAFELLQNQLQKLTHTETKHLLQENINYDIERLREGQYFQGLYKYISLLYPERETLLDFLDKDAILLIDEPIRLVDTARQMDQDEAESITSMLQDGKMMPGLKFSKAYDELLQIKPFTTLYTTLFLRQIPHAAPQNIVNFTCRPMQKFHGQMNVLKSEMERWRKNNFQVYVLTGTEERSAKVRSVFQDYQIDIPNMNQIQLQSGFEFPSARLVVITEDEIFSRRQRKSKRTAVKKIENAQRIKSYTDLKVGDYVVHVNHGIGKYVGIGTLEVGGVHKDYIHIQYAGDDKLSVPIDQIHLVQKYVGSEDKEPKLYKLGGTEWARVTKKARSSVKDIADDLVKLYAARQTAKGYAFSKDTPYQKEFEEKFPYEETEDQLRAIAEIKADMEKPIPMDRLLCGDVGYGKTEVAIRAAFKASMEGKQVAVLVPTTILAQQHYETFRERFADYPIHIEVLSRFRSRKEQRETIKGLKTGTVDIVIGTHRLLSSDIIFKDLGILIVDEEQRFGVTHKEKLKKLKMNVDVLTLTATPIPRTLHMSMLGIRDLSVIETPPENRFPVQTYVVEYSDTVVKEAIERELARNGQVYYLFNRVQGIYQIADQISGLVPDARVAICHGQMSEQELERTILDFLDGEYDVLVSTTIIETGVDIPNVNTLLVHNADHMGLSQLYQLRGRVGRSNRIAYAYFLYQRDKVLQEAAEKRLAAIKEFTELGSGFKIAMRDLTIRGAGNLLGAEQHGFIASVGFDLYSQMLEEEIEKKKKEITGEEKKEKVFPPTHIDIDLDAYIPSDYIYDHMQKIEIYKKIASIQTVDEIDELYDELMDRFGNLPDAVQHLLTVAKLKVYGRTYGIQSITRKKEDIHILFAEEASQQNDAHILKTLCKQMDFRMKYEEGKPSKLVIHGKGLSPQQAVDFLEHFLVQYNKALNKEELEHATS